MLPRTWVIYVYVIFPKCYIFSGSRQTTSRFKFILDEVMSLRQSVQWRGSTTYSAILLQKKVTKDLRLLLPVNVFMRTQCWRSIAAYCKYKIYIIYTEQASLLLLELNLKNISKNPIFNKTTSKTFADTAAKPIGWFSRG